MAKMIRKVFLLLSVLNITILAVAGCAMIKSSAPAVITPAFPDKYNNTYTQTVSYSDTKVYLSDGSGGWTDVTPKNVTTGESINCALFVDQHDGWAAGCDPAGSCATITIYKTADGGRDWTPVTAEIQIGAGGPVEFDFVDVNNGWLVVSQDEGAGQNAISLLKTTDGGATWAIISTNGLESGSTPVPDCFPGHALIRFYDTKNGYATVDDASGAVNLYATNDGGVTWLQQAVTPPEVSQNDWYNAYPPQFFLNGTGIMPVSCMPVSTAAANTSPDAANTMYFYMTSDAGKTWVLATPMTITGLETPTPLYCFSPDGKRGYMTDGTSLFTLTDDTWAKMSTDLHLTGEPMLYTGSGAGWFIPS